MCFSFGKVEKRRHNRLKSWNTKYHKEIQSFTGLLCLVTVAKPWLHNHCLGKGFSQRSVISWIHISYFHFYLTTARLILQNRHVIVTYQSKDRPKPAFTYKKKVVIIKNWCTKAQQWRMQTCTVHIVMPHCPKLVPPSKTRNQTDLFSGRHTEHQRRLSRCRKLQFNQPSSLLGPYQMTAQLN